jgi:hypothetical protein
LDRERFIKYYELIEDYVRQQDMIIEDPDIIFNKKSDYNNYSDSIQIYTNNLVYNAITLSNILAKENKYTSMHTIIPYRIIQIKVEGRTVAFLNKHLLVRKESCNQVCGFYNFIHKNNLSYSPPEYFMINKYNEWYQQPIDEKIIELDKIYSKEIINNMNRYKKKITEKIKNLPIEEVNEKKEVKELGYSEIVQKFIDSNDVIYYRTGFINTPIGIILNSSQRQELVKELKKKFREAKYVSGFLQNNYDIHIEVEYINIVKFILKSYNLTDYEVIPYAKLDVATAHPFVVKRLLLLDFISLYYLTNSADHARLYYQTIDFIDYIIEVLDKSMNEDLSKYNLYQGSYRDKNIDKSILRVQASIKSDNIMSMYVPEQYRTKTGKYKEIEKRDSDSNCFKK